MLYRLYKEGQGTWARGLLAGVVGISGIMMTMWVFERLQEMSWAQKPFFVIPFFSWAVKADVIVAGLVVVPFGVLGLWLYNHKKLADFLIETESELKNKVTWPTRKEAANNSIVVVITCVLMGIWVFGADLMFQFVSNMIYGVQ